MGGWWDSVASVARFNTWMQIAIVVFGVLTAAATALTIVASNRISDLQAKDAALLQARLGAAEKANKNVSGQLTDAIRNREEAEKALKNRLLVAESSAEKARETAAQASTQAEASQRAVQPRVLTSEQKSKLTSLLAAGQKGSADVVAVLGDGEAVAFAREFEGILKAAGWKTKGVSQAIFTGNPVGLTLVVRSTDSAPPYAGQLQRALAAIGLEAFGSIDSRYPANALRLIVGHKP